MGTNLPASHAKQVADFLQKVRVVRGRIAFVVDVTMSREQTWDAAAQLQGGDVQRGCQARRARDADCLFSRG